MDDTPAPRWQKLTALAVAAALAAVIVLVWGRLGFDFWPLDRSPIGPNLVASVITWAAAIVVGVLIWPPTRRRLHRFMDRKLVLLHSHAAHQTRLVEEMHHLAHTGEPHPRVMERRAAGLEPTAAHDEEA